MMKVRVCCATSVGAVLVDRDRNATSAVFFEYTAKNMLRRFHRGDLICADDDLLLLKWSEGNKVRHRYI
ncbi:hypothetical protein D3C71_2237270 [compost metagenome]